MVGRWSALAHPEKPHRLTVTVAGGDPSALGVALVDPGAGGKTPRVVLDTCVSGPPILKEGPPASFSWLVWPGCSEPQLLLLNRNSAGPVHLGTVKLVELDKVPESPSVRVPKTPATRTVGLYLTGSRPLDRFGGGGETGLIDSLEIARNLVSYASSCSASLVVLPERLSDRPGRRRLKGQAEENSTGPDQLEIVLRLLHRQGNTAWLELNLEGQGEAARSAAARLGRALRQGLVRIDRQGLADGPSYHPLHPAVRQALKRKVQQALAPHQDRTGFCRDPGAARSPGRPCWVTPIRAWTTTRSPVSSMTRSARKPRARSPGWKQPTPDRFATRSKYLSGVGRMPWLMWRSRAIADLYSELDEAARAASPGAVLALSTPVSAWRRCRNRARRVDHGRAGARARPGGAWAWISSPGRPGPNGPIVLRGVELSTDPLAHDLATSPDLDGKIAGRPQRGMLLTIDPEPVDPAMGHAAAADIERDGAADKRDLSDSPAGTGGEECVAAWPCLPFRSVTG